jgi:hypothetical protein
MAKTQKFVAYSNLTNHKSGAPVDPEDFGGVDSADFRYMLEHRTVVPVGDPDAPAPPDDEEEDQPAPSEQVSTDGPKVPADPSVRQPGQAPAEVNKDTGAVTQSPSGSSPASPPAPAAAAKPGGDKPAG